MKLFRRNRSNSISNKKIRNYIAYAIGEILLVVIGILIALSISNWNNTKIEKRTEIKIYENLKNQVIEGKEAVKGVIDYNDKYKEQFEYAMALISENDPKTIDTLQSLVLNIWKYSDINMEGNIYQTLVNSGELKLLKNEAIINRIQKLENSYIYMNRMEDIHFKVTLNYAGPGIVDNINIINRSVKEPSLLYSFEIQNLFFLCLEIMKEKNEIYNTAIREIEEIIALIDEELE